MLAFTLYAYIEHPQFTQLIRYHAKTLLGGGMVTNSQFLAWLKYSAQLQGLLPVYEQHIQQISLIRVYDVKSIKSSAITELLKIYEWKKIHQQINVFIKYKTPHSWCHDDVCTKI